MFTELHLHTEETSHCGRVSASDSIPRYKSYGYDAVVVTDHFKREYFSDYCNGTADWNTSLDRWLRGYRTAKEAGDKCGLKIFLGMEICFEYARNNDYLVYGITEELLYEHRQLWNMNEAQFKEFADKHKLFFAQAHPFRGYCTPCPKEYLHGVECFNAHSHNPSCNHKAIEHWLETKLLPICGSDFHDPDAILGCGVRFRKNADTIHDIVDMIFAKEYELVIPPGFECVDD